MYAWSVSLLSLPDADVVPPEDAGMPVPGINALPWHSCLDALMCLDTLVPCCPDVLMPAGAVAMHTYAEALLESACRRMPGSEG